MKTPISYYGGKQAIIRHLLELVDYNSDCYTEVFFGGGTLFWAKKPHYNETINDKLDMVVNFYQQLRSNFDELKRHIDESLTSRTTHAYALKIFRSPKGHPKVRRAWAFWYCCNFSYGNKIGGGVKFSNHQSITVPRMMMNKKDRFTPDLVKRIESVTIENTDALWVLNSRNTKKAFHYLDPPYMNADQGHYKGYTWDNYEELLDTCTKLKGKFLLSNYQSDLLDKYIKENGWTKKLITHRIAAPRKSGPAKVEVLVYNYKPQNQMEIFEL